MAKEWDKIDINEILNFNEGHTGKMSQYERIMQHRLTDAVSILSEKLTGVMETIYRTHQGLKQKADELQAAYEDITKKQMNSYKQISDSQSRLQRWVVALTFIIAISTVAYVIITWMSVSTLRESNAMQRATVAAMKEANEMQRATVEAMQESNRIQIESLRVNSNMLQLEQSSRWKGYTVEPSNK